MPCAFTRFRPAAPGHGSRQGGAPTDRPRVSTTSRWWVVAAAVAVLVVALLPRLDGIGLFLTADEKNWVGRGSEFLSAVREFRFNDTLQTTHPGIPTLWVAGLSNALTSRLLGQPFTFDAIRAFVRSGQIFFAVLNSLLVLALFVAARLILPTSLALLASLVMALDPFLIGHSKIVHVDALLAGLTALSLIIFLGAERRAWPPRLLFASAVIAALAVLTKLPALILIPLALAVLFVSPAKGRPAERGQRIRLFAQWLTFLVVSALLLWPGLLWVPDPVGNIKIVKRDLEVAVSTPHHRTDAYSVSFGHYPKALLSRTTIPTLLGSIIAVLLLLLRPSVLSRFRRESPVRVHSPLLTPAVRRPLTFLVLFVTAFILLMTVGAKKGDRYILPVFPVIDLLAAWGTAAAVHALRPRWAIHRAAALAGVLLLPPLLVEVVRLGPYTLAHYNPLFPPNFSQELGWGEGLDQVAEFLNGQNDGDRVSAASWYPEELGALVRRPVLHLNGHGEVHVGYVVLYRNMFGRPPGHPAREFLETYYAQQTPAFTAVVNGLPYAWVYRRSAFLGVVGELRPGTILEAELPVARGTIRAVEVFLATYQGRANSGELVVRLRDARSAPVRRVGRLPVQSTADNQWVAVPLNASLAVPAARTLLVEVTTSGTARGRAPTIRTAPEEREAPLFWMSQPVSGPGREEATRRGAGRVGIRAVLSDE